MVKIIAAVLVVVALLSVGAYVVFQPNTLPTPIFETEPTGVSQTTVTDTRIADPRWLSKDGNLLWVVCRFGAPGRARCNLLINLAEKKTMAMLRGANLVSWINDHEVLVYNRGKTDSKWDQFQLLINPNDPSYVITQFFVLDVNSKTLTRICELASSKNLTSIDTSPNGERVVLAFGPKELYEFETSPGTSPKEIIEEYVWAPKWLDDETYSFVGQTRILLRKFGTDRSTILSRTLETEIRDALMNFGSPTIRVSGTRGR